MWTPSLGHMEREEMLEKKVITINKNKINIDFSELEKEINNLKISSKKLFEVVNVETTIELVSNELIIFKDNKCIANYIIESGNKSNFSSLKFLHLGIRILNNFGLMIDGEIDDSPFKTEKKINQIDGIRFQPVLLNAYNNDNPENKGMGLFSRGLHFLGFITPSNFRLCCICDECKKSFNIHSYHAGNGYFQYFYSDDGSETLMVPYDAIKDMPGQLCKNISEESVKRIDSQLEKKGYGRFKFYNPFRCPYCKAPYIDFQKHPEIREYEYYANVFLNKEMVEYKEKK